MLRYAIQVDAFLTLVVLPVAEGRTATGTAHQEAALEVFPMSFTSSPRLTCYMYTASLCILGRLSLAPLLATAITCSSELRTRLARKGYVQHAYGSDPMVCHF